jgi:hypothetical protein
LISNPSPLFSSAAETSCSPSSFVISQPGTVSGRVVVAIFPSSETRTEVCFSTLSTCVASPRKASTRFFAAGLIAPEPSFQTTKTSCPE